MCGKNIDGGSLLRAWFVLLLLLLVALVGEKVWPEGSGPGSPQIMKPDSSTTSEKWDALQNVLSTLKAESTALATDSETLSNRLAVLQTEHDALKSSWKELLSLWENCEKLRKAEREAAEAERRALLDRALAAERNTRILGGVCIGTTVAGVIGWLLYIVAR